MCDTMVALSGCTADGSVLFAKNSDREPNEPHIIIRSPRRRLMPGEKTQCTYIAVENTPYEEYFTHDTLLFKPSWIWGAEMGVNEKGLVIGNEAVFTKEKVEDKTLLGMDILRLALEHCSNAREALDYITSLLEKYGQGGKAGYTENLRYHNSYILADFSEAYVLETAGRHWIYKQITDIYSISNTLSIRGEYDSCSNELVENAVSKGWCRSSGGFDFKACYESRLHPHFTKGDTRRAAAESYMRNRQGKLDINDMKAILRSHGGKKEVEGFRSGSMECICMHAGGGLITSQTTGSLVVQLKEGRIDIWATGSSIPCISVFKPLWFTSAGNISEDGQDISTAAEFWYYAEEIHRKVLNGSITALGDYLSKRDRLEQELTGMAEEASTDDERMAVMRHAFERENGLLAELAPLENKADIGNSRLYYRMYWKLQNKKLMENNKHQ